MSSKLVNNLLGPCELQSVGIGGKQICQPSEEESTPLSLLITNIVVT